MVLKVDSQFEVRKQKMLLQQMCGMSAFPALAHHLFSRRSSMARSRLKLEGTVTKVEWTNLTFDDIWM
jgi:hypothetical protein